MTREQEDTIHLRLVFDARQKAPNLRPAEKRAGREQLAFPYPDVTSVFLVYVGTMSHNEFRKVVGEVMPRWIFDVRAVPRFDTIVGSRPSAFHLFAKAKAAYVDVLGKVGATSYRSADSNPAVWGNVVCEILRISDRKGPYLFLFDDKSLFQASDEILPRIVKPVIGKEAHFSILGDC